jgi:hypothetical protein
MMMQKKSMTLLQRMQAPTPKFFKVVRTIGVALVAAGGVLLASPIALPAVVISIASYATVAGSVMTAVSQSAVKEESA